MEIFFLYLSKEAGTNGAILNKHKKSMKEESGLWNLFESGYDEFCFL